MNVTRSHRTTKVPQAALQDIASDTKGVPTGDATKWLYHSGLVTKHQQVRAVADTGLLDISHTFSTDRSS